MTSERVQRIREQQRGVADLTMQEVADLFAAQVLAHADHEQRQDGPCVYCVPCGVRIGQGTARQAQR